MVKELRLPFADYPAEEQERDELCKKGKTRDVYIMRVDGVWGGYMPRNKLSITFNAPNGADLTEFVSELRKELSEMGINARFRCVRNLGIEEQIRKTQFLIKESGRD